MADEERTSEQEAEQAGDTPATILDDLDAPTILVEGIRGLQVRSGIVSLNFTNSVLGLPGSENEGRVERTVCRLAMSPIVLAQFADFFAHVRDRFVEDGVLEPVDPTEPQE